MALLDQPPQALREWHPAGVDADERDLVEVGVPLDDLVGDPGERPAEGVLVQERLPGGAGRQRHSTPFRPLWTGLKGFGSRGTLHRWPDIAITSRRVTERLVSAQDSIDEPNESGDPSDDCRCHEEHAEDVAYQKEQFGGRESGERDT